MDSLMRSIKCVLKSDSSLHCCSSLVASGAWFSHAGASGFGGIEMFKTETMLGEGATRFDRAERWKKQYHTTTLSSVLE